MTINLVLQAQYHNLFYDSMCDATNCENQNTMPFKINGHTMLFCEEHFKVAKQGMDAFENRTPSWENVPE